MNELWRIGGLGALLLSSFASTVRPKEHAVNLVVIKDGHQMLAPAEIKATFDNRVVRLPLHEGKFEAPPELILASKVVLEMDVRKSHIRLTNMNGGDFTGGKWTLRLAERANDDYYEWPGPKDADISSSCMLELDSGHEDPARVLFLQHCRSKVR